MNLNISKKLCMNNNNDRWADYYKQVMGYPHRPQTEEMIRLNHSGVLRAIDCGCGTGSDMAYLASQGYEVHGFDSHPASVELCQQRFKDQPNIYISNHRFDDFNYPPAGLVIAYYSLFFCPPHLWKPSWQKIDQAVVPEGVFCGDFMGNKDSWVTEVNHQLNPMSEAQVRDLFHDSPAG